ncbi:MAG: glycosyltransferase [Bacteroidales bacterium]|nr:glycosyltransferase [Bacteroidales bacterium]MDY2917041.1 glycosyltransferase family 2 protein [Muribaculaceae bacterium]
MEPRPLFSIITVTYNAAATVRATMESVASQTCLVYEHLVMDGASKDSTLSIVDDLSTERTRVHSSPDRGIYDAMNKGLDQARGDYVIFLNAGDRFHSEHTLQRIADVIMASDYPGVVYGQTDLVDGEGHYVGPRHLTAPEQLTLDSFKHGMLVCHQAFVALRRLCPQYDTRWRFSADYEWCIRVLQHSRRNVYTGDVLIDYLSEGMTTRNRNASLKERYHIMCQYYGTLPTIMRHVGFFGRNLMRKFRRKK